MKLSFLLYLCISFAVTSNFYDNEVRLKNGEVMSLSSVRSKKVLVVITAQKSSADDSSVLNVINHVAKKFSSQLKVIIIPSSQFKAVGSGEFNLASMDSSIIFCEPLFTKSQGDTLQHPLISWLSKPELNGHVADNDVRPGTCFLVDESGKLVAAIKGGTPLSEKLFDRIMR